MREGVFVWLTLLQRRGLVLRLVALGGGEEVRQERGGATLFEVTVMKYPMYNNNNNNANNEITNA